MSFFDLVLIAVGLSMDAFAVSLCKGLNMRKINYRHTAVIALFFGGFQALMPLIGWFLGTRFIEYIEQYDHWVAFVLLAFIGGKMLVDAFKDKDECECCQMEKPLDLWELLLMAIATSIDALAVGIALAVSNVNIGSAVTLIGAVTFVLCFVGVIIGNNFGAKYKTRAQIAGGIVLVGIGVKILVEGLM